MEPHGEELIRRYMDNYHMSEDAEITEDMILRHWVLEKRLAEELLESTSENRWQVFDECYTKLYSELEWLNRLVGTPGPVDQSERYMSWAAELGSPPKRVYEVGSGRGELVTYLASLGFDCVGTDITKERGLRDEPTAANLKWGLTDGVHLDSFEQPGTYDVVISNSVVEHLHPGDLEAHFRGVFSILVERGEYILCTPHLFTGPHDVSSVFDCDRPLGMHLKEFTYRDMVEVARRTGFKRWRRLTPRKIVKLLRKLGMESHAYLRIAGVTQLALMRFTERILGCISDYSRRRKAALRLNRLKLFDQNLCMVFEKP